ncbi:MAG: phosphoglucosamine mutase [Eggerthellaceae bacterium]|jgi:phosphomannomutase|nr:phosphoglucosamine mutase [Eggerthellaceae bacterium]MDR2715474.1 phosphoglucomutase/phosphomannomutase family protein [Coriobacteriaceae bacterium]
MGDTIHFGTDGWRAIIGEGFTDESLIRVSVAAAQAFKEGMHEQGTVQAPQVAQAADGAADGAAAPQAGQAPPTIIVGYDCRKDARRFAQLAAQVVAAQGFRVKLSHDYCPTPALCWSVAQDDAALGGIMLTSSHNPAEYLGVKLRMADGGASPAGFTDRVESLLEEGLPEGGPAGKRDDYEDIDLVGPYLEALKGSVDADMIRAARLKVVVDPLYGAGRVYLAGLLESLGVEVFEINNAEDPTFDGLHPEPIPPWIDRGLAKARELACDALFVTDGDADRIAAGDSQGNFVNPHRILTLLVAHLAQGRGQTGRVVTTVTSSALLSRQCRRLGLDLTTTAVGFKWIYAEMAHGDVMIGGEESGGIGIPSHVKERDGLLMALLLAEAMAHRKMDLGALVDDMFESLGRLEFARRGLSISETQMARFCRETIPRLTPEAVCGKAVTGIDRSDGIKLSLEGDAWLMMRPSGTEPLVRIYAEAATLEEVGQLLDTAEGIVAGG